MITSTYSRIVLGLMLGMLASSINAQNQISDEALITLAKQKQDKIKPEDYIKFFENFWDSTMGIRIKKSALTEEDRTYLILHIEKIKKEGLSEFIKQDLTVLSKKGKGIIFRQQLKQWLDKY